MKHNIIVIPSLNPDLKLLELVRDLRNHFIQEIIVVDDGSDTSCHSIFNTLGEEYHCILLRHHTNQGKGRALKTAFNKIACDYPDVDLIVTVDGDGQHLPDDIFNCLDHASHFGLTLGVRQFTQDIPWKSRAGNLITRNVLKLFTGIPVSDSQTGLRVFSKNAMIAALGVSGERYEYETNMLIELHNQGFTFNEVPIATVYYDNNARSHFNVFKDSWLIYKVFIKYLFSSASAFVLDLIIFSLVLTFMDSQSLRSITIATFIARFISSLYNYKVNQKLVFQQSSQAAIIKYFSLVIVQFISSSLLVYFLNRSLIRVNTTLIKVFVDFFIFMLNFYIQKKYIFVGKPYENL